MTPRACAFISAIEAVCREHGLIIVPEGHDGLQVWPLEESDLELYFHARMEDRTPEAG